MSGRSVCGRALAAVLSMAVYGSVWGPASPSWAAAGTLADASGELVAWGLNDFGQATAPPGTFVAINGGYRHSLAVRADGSLLVWGDNTAGQTNAPPGTFLSADGGNSHSTALRTDGTLATGWGYAGAVGTTPTGTFTQIATMFNHNIGLRTDGSIAVWGDNTYGQFDVPTGNTFTSVSAGYGHSLALRSDGTLAGWGRNLSGEATVPPGAFKAVSAGGYFGIAIRTNGTLAGWGRNLYGPLNLPSGQFAAVSAGWEHVLGLRPDGTLLSWGRNLEGQNVVPAGTFVAVATGLYHNLALRARTLYDGDLLVSGTGLSATLNRSITVGGGMTVSSLLTLQNNPTADIAGDLVLANGGLISGAGLLRAGGALTVSADSAALFGSMDVQATGLKGSGLLQLNGASLTLGPAHAFTGRLSVNSGLLALGGTQNALSLTNLLTAAAGEVRVAPGQRLTVGPLPSSNAGFFRVIGTALAPAEVEFTGSLINQAGTGTITAQHATLRFTGGLTSGGAIVVPGGAADLFGDVHSTGSISLANAATALFHGNLTNAGGKILLPAGTTLHVGGRLAQNAGGTTTGGAIVANSLSGSFTLNGKILLRDTLTPSASPLAALSLPHNGGVYTGQLDITRNALALTTANPADKAARRADLAAAIAAGASGGTWTGNGITSSTAAADPLHYTVGLFDNADLQLAILADEFLDPAHLIVAYARLGDTNLDNKVDAFDLNALAAHWQQPAGAITSSGDFTRDGKVDAFDLNVLAAHWQAGSNSALFAFQASVAAQAPEPATLAVLLPAMLLLTGRNRTRKPL